MRYLIQAKEGKFAKEVWWQCVEKRRDTATETKH